MATTGTVEVVPSPHAIWAMCVSRKPGSTNVAFNVIGVPSTVARSGPPATAGATFTTVTDVLAMSLPNSLMSVRPRLPTPSSNASNVGTAALAGAIEAVARSGALHGDHVGEILEPVAAPVLEEVVLGAERDDVLAVGAERVADGAEVEM